MQKERKLAKGLVNEYNSKGYILDDDAAQTLAWAILDGQEWEGQKITPRKHPSDAWYEEMSVSAPQKSSAYIKPPARGSAIPGVGRGGDAGRGKFWGLAAGGHSGAGGSGGRGGGGRGGRAAPPEVVRLKGGERAEAIEYWERNSSRASASTYLIMRRGEEYILQADEKEEGRSGSEYVRVERVGGRGAGEEGKVLVSNLRLVAKEESASTSGSGSTSDEGDSNGDGDDDGFGGGRGEGGGRGRGGSGSDDVSDGGLSQQTQLGDDSQMDGSQASEVYSLT